MTSLSSAVLVKVDAIYVVSFKYIPKSKEPIHSDMDRFLILCCKTGVGMQIPLAFPADWLYNESSDCTDIRTIMDRFLLL